MQHKRKFTTIQLLATLLGVTVADLRCSQVLEQWYPTMTACDSSTTCFGDMACVIELPERPGQCAKLHCQNKHDCPPETTYSPFYPRRHEMSTMDIQGSIGNACYPRDKYAFSYFGLENVIARRPRASFSTTISVPRFNCNFNAANGFALTVNAQVPSIIRHDTSDNRNITLISWDAYKGHNSSDPYNIFDGSLCHGENELSMGITQFLNVQNGQNNCYFTNLGLSVEEDGAYYTQKFVVGYDDLTDFTPNGHPVFKSFGNHWIVNCRIKATNTIGVGN